MPRTPEVRSCATDGSNQCTCVSMYLSTTCMQVADFLGDVATMAPAVAALSRTFVSEAVSRDGVRKWLRHAPTDIQRQHAYKVLP